MIKIGITGGIGSGKSTVCRLFSIIGDVPIYDCDLRAKILMDSDPEIIGQIRRLLGHGIYVDDKLNRGEVAKRVFKDKDLLGQLNSIVHASVGKDFERWVELVELQDLERHKYIIMESAILFESGFDRYVHKTVNISAPVEDAIVRTMARDNVSRASVVARMENQMTNSQREALADYIVANDMVHPLEPQIEELHSIFCNMGS